MADLLSNIKNAAWLASRKASAANITNIGGIGSLTGKINFLTEAAALPSAAAEAWNGVQGLYETGEGILKRRPLIETARRSNTPGYQPTGPIGIGSIPPKDKTGESYRDQELRLSAAARAAGGPSAGGGIGGGNMASYVPNPQSSPAAERAYRQQLSSTAQQVAQDPQLDDFAKQRALDVASKDYSKSEDMGMKIWAERHKDLAAKVKPGQAGYDTIQQVLHGTMQQPMTQNLYTNAPTFSSVENYANQQPNAIVRPLGTLPAYAMDNPMQGDYNSTVKQAYNLPYPIIPTTTIGADGVPTNSAPMSAALYTPNSSTQAFGTYSGPPVKLPMSQTGFGAPGYPTITAGAMIPNVDVSKAFGADGIDPALRAKFYAMHTAN